MTIETLFCLVLSNGEYESCAALDAAASRKRRVTFAAGLGALLLFGAAFFGSLLFGVFCQIGPVMLCVSAIVALLGALALGCMAINFNHDCEREQELHGVLVRTLECFKRGREGLKGAGFGAELRLEVVDDTVQINYVASERIAGHVLAKERIRGAVLNAEAVAGLRGRLSNVASEDDRQFLLAFLSP